jgi:hypothetical protein
MPGSMFGNVDREKLVRTASERSTTSVVIAFAENPNESVTLTARVKVPETLGVQFSINFEADEQPEGNPR